MIQYGEQNLTFEEQGLVTQHLSEPPYGRMTYESAIKALCQEVEKLRIRLHDEP